MKTEEVPRVDLPHVPKLVQVNTVHVLNVEGCTVDGDLQAELKKHGDDEEGTTCHCICVGVKTVAKVEREAVRAHKDVGDSAGGKKGLYSDIDER